MTVAVVLPVILSFSAGCYMLLGARLFGGKRDLGSVPLGLTCITIGLWVLGGAVELIATDYTVFSVGRLGHFVGTAIRAGADPHMLSRLHRRADACHSDRRVVDSAGYVDRHRRHQSMARVHVAAPGGECRRRIPHPAACLGSVVPVCTRTLRLHDGDRRGPHPGYALARSCTDTSARTAGARRIRLRAHHGDDRLRRRHRAEHHFDDSDRVCS